MGNYDAQIDWLYASQSLSIQRDYTASSKDYSGSDDPDESDLLSMLVLNALKFLTIGALTCSRAASYMALFLLPSAQLT